MQIYLLLQANLLSICLIVAAAVASTFLRLIFIICSSVFCILMFAGICSGVYVLKKPGPG